MKSFLPVLKRFLPPLFIGVAFTCVFFAFRETSEKSWERFPIERIDSLIHESYLRHSPEFYSKKTKFLLEQLQRNPRQSNLYNELSVAYHRQGNPSKALSVLEMKLQIPESKEKHQMYAYHSNRGTILSAQGLSQVKQHGNPLGKKNIQSGLLHLKQALSVAPPKHAHHIQLEIFMTEWLRDALFDANKFEREDALHTPFADQSLLRQRGSPQKCGQRYRHAVPPSFRVKVPSDQVDYYICVSVIEGLSSALVAGHPHTAALYATLGNVLLSAGEPERAFRAYAKAIKRKHPASELLTKYMYQLSASLLDHETTLTAERKHTLLWDDFRKAELDGDHRQNAYQAFEVKRLSEGALPSSRKLRKQYQALISET